MLMESSTIIKMYILPRAIFRFSVIFVKIPKAFFTEIKKNPKIYMESQKVLNSQCILEKKEQNWRYHTS